MRAEKIVLLGDHPPPPGGLSVHVQSLHHLLRRSGFEVNVLDIGKGGQASPGVVTVHSGTQLLRQLTRFAGAGHRLHVHISGNNPKAWRVAGLGGVAWVLRTRRPVLTVHSGLFPTFAAQSVTNRALIRAVIPCFDRIIGVSDAVSRALLELGASPAQLRTLPAFIWEPGMPIEPPPELAAAQSRFHPLLAYAHHPSPVYGRLLMLSALRKMREQMPQAGAVVFGPGLEPGGPWDVAVGDVGLRDAVCTLGELPRQQVFSVLRQADVFVRPTYADGDSVSVREALACGTRCVASDAASRPAGVETFRTGDAGDLVAVLRRALALRPKRVRTSDAGPALLRLYDEMTSLERESGALRATA